MWVTDNTAGFEGIRDLMLENWTSPATSWTLTYEKHALGFAARAKLARALPPGCACGSPHAPRGGPNSHKHLRISPGAHRLIGRGAAELMMLGSTFAIGIVALSTGARAATDSEGLWLSRDEGVRRAHPVVRRRVLRHCGGSAAKTGKKKERPEDTCGKPMMKDFTWNAKARRWEGTMQRGTAPLAVPPRVHP